MIDNPIMFDVSIEACQHNIRSAVKEFRAARPTQKREVKRTVTHEFLHGQSASFSREFSSEGLLDTLDHLLYDSLVQ
jgi:hypothetical protein